MADRKISELSQLNGADVNANDVVAVADISANETRKVTIKDLAEAGYRVSANGSIPLEKVQLFPNTLDGNVIKDDSLGSQQIGPNAIGESELADDSVDTAALQDGAVTTEKLADGIDAAKLADGSVTTSKLANNAVTISKLGLSNNELDGAVLINNSVTDLQLAPNSVGSSELANEAVDTDSLQDGAVTTDKLADGIDAAKLLDKSITSNKIGDQQIQNGHIQDATIEGGKIAFGTIEGSNIASNTINADHIASNSITADELADGSVDTAALQDNAVTGPKLSDTAFNRGLGKDADGKVGIINQITPGAHAGITYDEQGLITSTTSPIPSSDLPIATETEVGVVSIPPDGGLSVNAAGAVRIRNTIASGEGYKIEYDEHGLVTGSGDIEAEDLPIATATTLGAVMVPNIDSAGDASPISVDGSGAISHDESGVTPGTYPKVIVDKHGHVTGGGPLEESDIPEISADNIVGGELNPDLLPECSVTAPKICDYATCLMQEDNPGAGDFLGQFWYTPSTAQLRVYARGSGPENIWLPVGFGALQANNLRWGGTYDADTDTLVMLTAIGVSEGLTAGQPFPAPTDQMSGIYFICQVAGNNCSQPNINNQTHTAGDWALCIDQAQGWIHIDANAGSGGGGGGSAQYLNDLLDVEIGGASSPFSAAGDTERVDLSRDHILRYDGNAGLWRNTDIIDGGSID